MKFKDKNGNIFIPTSKCIEEEMKNSKFYAEIKEVPKPKEKPKESE